MAIFSLIFLSAPSWASSELAASDKLSFEPAIDLKNTYGGLLKSESGLILAGSTLSVLVAMPGDTSAQNYFLGQNRIGGSAWLGNDVLGTGVPGVLLGAGLWTYGGIAQDWREYHAGVSSLEALLGTFVLTSVLKVTVNRTRPDGSTTDSFPSGHTSTMAASSAVLAKFYGWKAGIPAFALTTLTAFSRLDANKHWLSDTVAGAGLGIWIGALVAGGHLSAHGSDGEVSWSVLPILRPGGGELVFSLAM